VSDPNLDVRVTPATLDHETALQLLRQAADQIADLTLQRDTAVSTATELGHLGRNAIDSYRAEVTRLNKIIDGLVGA